jgi:hypothetical protein
VVRWILLLFLSFFFGEKVLSSSRVGGEIQFFSFGGEEDSICRF